MQWESEYRQPGRMPNTKFITEERASYLVLSLIETCSLPSGGWHLVRVYSGFIQFEFHDVIGGNWTWTFRKI